MALPDKSKNIKTKGKEEKRVRRQKLRERSCCWNLRERSCCWNLRESSMDNEAFEMQGEKIPGNSRRMEELQKIPEKLGRKNLLRIFLLCLLASVLSSAILGLVLGLVWKNEQKMEKMEQKVEGKFRFLNKLKEAKVYKYPGGEIQWARYRRDPRDYENAQAKKFGQSLNSHRSQITVGTLRIEGEGLRVPHWHFNANEHGYLVEGKAWIGLIDADTSRAVTYNVTSGQLVFFPRNRLHWVKNVGSTPLLFLLFFSTHNELLTLDMDDAFFGTPEAEAARALKPIGGIDFIRTFQKQEQDQAINLPPNLQQLIHNSSYPQSEPADVSKFFFDLPASKEFPFPGGVFQWARFRKNGTGLTENERIYSESLGEHENSLTLATLRIFTNNSGVPHFHFNANEVGVVLQGCGQVGLILPEENLEFPVEFGDVVFFPLGSQHFVHSQCPQDLLLLLAYSTGNQHFVHSQCQDDLLLLLAYSTGNQLETLRMDQYFHGTPEHILAQLFHKDQLEFQKIPKIPKIPKKFLRKFPKN